MGIERVKPVESFVRMAENVYRLQVDFPGCWTGVTLVTGECPVLVDSGGCAETVDRCIQPALKEMGLTFADIAWLVLTHIHGDHVGGCSRLKALAPSLRVAVYRDSADRLADPLAYSRAIRSRFPLHSPAPPAGLSGVRADRLLADGDRVGPLRLLHTPGHDTDACCYLHERTQTLITGDSLQLNGTCSQGCALLLDPGRYRETLDRLMALQVESIVCGHPYLPLGAEALGADAVRRYLAMCLGCHEHDRGFVAGMAAAGVSDTAAIARALIADIGGRRPEHLFLPMHTVEGYLAMTRRSDTA